MAEDKRLEAERQELNLLIDKGVSFEVEQTILSRPAGLLGLVRKRSPRHSTLKFTIKEPTLSTLDRISAEQIELQISESVMSSESGLQEAKKMVLRHGRRLARIVALCVMGEDYVIQYQKQGRVVYGYNNKELDRLTDLFFHNIKPSKLFQLVLLVSSISNLGDFTNSIRLMSASRTTMPILIEENKKV